MVESPKSKSKATTSVLTEATLEGAAGVSQTFHLPVQHTLRLLLIEDYAALAEAVADWLRQMGMDVRVAGSRSVQKFDLVEIA